jgi:hypothetical protein
MARTRDTRSFIATATPNGYRGIYCLWDGYLEGVGAILQQYYTDPTKLDQLIRLGDISSLGAEIGERHDSKKYHPFFYNESYVSRSLPMAATTMRQELKRKSLPR